MSVSPEDLRPTSTDRPIEAPDIDDSDFENLDAVYDAVGDTAVDRVEDPDPANEDDRYNDDALRE